MHKTYSILYGYGFILIKNYGYDGCYYCMKLHCDSQEIKGSFSTVGSWSFIFCFRKGKLIWGFQASAILKLSCYRELSQHFLSMWKLRPDDPSWNWGLISPLLLCGLICQRETVASIQNAFVKAFASPSHCPVQSSSWNPAHSFHLHTWEFLGSGATPCKQTWSLLRVWRCQTSAEGRFCCFWSLSFVFGSGEEEEEVCCLCDPFTISFKLLRCLSVAKSDRK